MLYRRGSTWWVRFTLGGREVRRSAKTADRAQAEAFERKLREDTWRERHLGERTHSWADAVEGWIASTPAKRSRERDEIILAWLQPHIPSKTALPSLTAQRIAEIQRIKAGESSLSTANRYAALIRAVLRFAVDQGMLARAPRIKLYALPAQEHRWATREQVDALCARLRPLQAEVARFAVLTGLRRTNITHLRWSEVDLDRRVVYIPAAKAKAGKPIPVPLNDEALAVLERRKGAHEEWVFARKSAGVPLLQTSTRRWREACAEVGLVGFRFHDLRHTWATWHILAGTPLHVLQELGGWRSYEMVRRYAHLNPQHLAGWAGNIGGQISAQNAPGGSGVAKPP